MKFPVIKMVEISEIPKLKVNLQFAGIASIILGSIVLCAYTDIQQRHRDAEHLVRLTDGSLEICRIHDPVVTLTCRSGRIVYGPGKLEFADLGVVK